MKKKLLDSWEQVGLYITIPLLIVVGVMEIFFNCFTAKFPTITSIFTGLITGYIATIVVLYLERRHRQKELYDFYKTIEGDYIRVDIGQDNTEEAEQNAMRDDNVGLSITLEYSGGHSFKIRGAYWKSHQVEGLIEFNSNERTSAVGKYKYVSTGKYSNIFGRYEIQRDETKNELIVIFQHIFPRTKEYNPDNSRGWEVWQKT